MENLTTTRSPIFNRGLCFLLFLLLIFTITTLYRAKKKSKCEPEGFLGSIEGFAMVRVGGNSYKIHEDLQDPIKAAQTMDKLNTVAKSLIDKLHRKYILDRNGMNLINDAHKQIVQKGIKDLTKKFVSANMEENIPERSGGDTSYVVNKGDVFAMCLRDPTNGNQLDPKFNDLTFVLLHELSHLFCSQWGHPTEFWENFKFVLQEAVDFGLYTKTDYKKLGSDYCGIVITYSPLYDSKLIEYHK